METWKVIAGMVGVVIVLSGGDWVLRKMAQIRTIWKEEHLKREEEGVIFVRSHRGAPRRVRILGPSSNGRVRIVWRRADGGECFGARQIETLERLRLQ